MARKPRDQESEQTDMPLTGKGVEQLKIPDIERSYKAWQKFVKAREEESEPEKAAKFKFRAAMHDHRSELPLDKDDLPFYRIDGLDLVIDEAIRARKVRGVSVDVTEINEAGE